MWQRYTERAKRAIWYADEEAKMLGSGKVLTEHLLLGVVRDPDATAVKLLKTFGAGPHQVRVELGKHLPRSYARSMKSVFLAPSAKRVLDLAHSEAFEGLQENHIGTEHLLLGLIGDEDGGGGRVLEKLGVTLERTRDEIRALRRSTTSSSGSKLKPN